MTIKKPVHTLPLPALSDPRRVSVDVHHHLRRLIIDAVLPAGSVLKQAELARIFGVSRTPMREAFRMLQEEGLIEAETNQRAHVRDLDPNELDQLYSARITLECLGVRITAGRITPIEVTQAHQALRTMDEAMGNGDMDAWAHAHRLFHRLCEARADEPLVRVIHSYSERTERYVRLHQMRHQEANAIARAEHEGILEAVISGNRDEAGKRMAQHLATTSFAVLSDVSADSAGLAISEALAMASASGASSQLRRSH